MPKITTFLAYDHQAEAAAQLYVSVFPNSRILNVTRYGEGGPGPAGTAMTVVFELDGQEYIALNGGPHFKFTDGVSLSVECQTQAEIDTYWEKLTAGGQPGRCGWLTDRFGLSWQINPAVLGRLLSDPDPVKAGRVMDTMLKMDKFSIPDLERAYRGA